jgi:hypothetical protein
MHTTKILLITACAALCFTSADAQAQPNPFEDYEGSQRTLPTGQRSSNGPSNNQQANTKAPPKALAVSVGEKYKQGNIRAGASGAFSYNSTNNEVSGGGEVANSTLFLLLAVQGGYFLLDNIEIGAQLGYMSRDFARGENETANSRELLALAQGRYHVPFSDRLSLAPVLGLGFYTGSSDRQITLLLGEGNRLINEQTSTVGFALSAGIDFNYLLTEQLQLLIGVNLVGLVGTESSQLEDSSFFGTGFHTNLNIGLMYLF